MEKVNAVNADSPERIWIDSIPQHGMVTAYVSPMTDAQSAKPLSVEYVRADIAKNNSVNEIKPLAGESTERAAEAADSVAGLLRSLMPRLCDFCRQGKDATKWGLQETNNVSFTHWTGYDHIPCGADSIRTWLDSRADIASTDLIPRSTVVKRLKDIVRNHGVEYRVPASLINDLAQKSSGSRLKV